MHNFDVKLKTSHFNVLYRSLSRLCNPTYRTLHIRQCLSAPKHEACFSALPSLTTRCMSMMAGNDNNTNEEGLRGDSKEDHYLRWRSEGNCYMYASFIEVLILVIAVLLGS